MRRNSFIILLGIYELLLEEPQTFYGLRAKIGVGFRPLRKLLDQLIEDGLVEVTLNDDKEYFTATPRLYELFEGSFYDGLRRLKRD